MMVAFIDAHRTKHGVEPICKQLPIAPSTYHECKVREREPEQISAHRLRDQVLCMDIRRIWEGNFRVYGARKVWRQLNREGINAARCTVERLMKDLGLQGVRRGRQCWTTIADDVLLRPVDRVNRQFVATRPNQHG